MIYAVLRWPFCNWPPNVVFFHLQFNTWMQNLKSVCVKLVKEPNLFFISKYHYDIWGNDLKIERCPLFIKYSCTKNQSLCWDYYTRVNITLKDSRQMKWLTKQFLQSMQFLNDMKVYIFKVTKDKQKNYICPQIYYTFIWCN